MKNRIYLRSTLRQPARTIFLILLIGLISFAFTARTVEYILVQRETARLGEYYRSIGSLQNAGQDNYDVTAGANLISNSKYIEFEDRRRTCSGVLDGLYNGDIGGQSNDGYQDTSYGVHNSDVFIYGELISAPIPTKIEGQTEKYEAYQFQLRVDRVMAGYPEHASEGKNVILYFIVDGDQDAGVLDELKVGNRYFLKAFYDFNNANTLMKPYENLIMKPLNGSGLWFLPVEPGESVDFETPELAGLKEELELLEENQRAMVVTGTKDMSAMPNVQQSSQWYYLADGRWLNRDDDLNGRNVCVVHREFASFRNLSVGDTITLTFRDFDIVYGGYILEGGEWENWREFPTQTESFEIVGLYGITSPNPVQPTLRNVFMFIPDSRMPEGFGGDPQSQVLDYSFVLKSSQDQNAFLRENREALAEMGFAVSFVENNADNFWASVTPIRQSATFSAAVFASVLLIGLVLCVFLYLRLRRKDFAIMRALGVPVRKAAGGLLGPMALIGLLGIPAGGIPSWRYAMTKAGETLAAISGPEGVEIAAELSPVWLAAICAGIFALLLIFVLIGAALLSRRPTLELLQGVAGRRRGGKKPKAGGNEPKRPADDRPAEARTERGPEKARGNQTQSAAPLQAPGDESPGLAVSVRYVFRQIRPGPIKTILTTALALGFVVALGWMDLTIERSQAEADRLYAATVVEAEIVKSDPSEILSGTAGSIINKSTVDAILESGFVRDVYLEACVEYKLMVPYLAGSGSGEGSEAKYDESRMLRNVIHCALDQPEAFCRRHEIEIEYAPGWDARIFTQELRWNYVILPANMLSQLGLELGDEIFRRYEKTTGDTEYSSSGPYIIAGQYTGQVALQDTNEPVLIGMSAQAAIEESMQAELHYSTAEFVLDPAKNRELSAFRDEMTELVGSPKAGLLDLSLVMRDEELTQVVGPMEQNIRLLSVLYPVTAALSVLIAAGVSILLLLQSAREAAALRAVGCTRLRVGAMLSVQQGLLCLLGIALGFAGLAVLRGGLAGVFSIRTLLCAGLYFAGAVLGAVFTSVSIVRRKPMELLQVKE